MKFEIIPTKAILYDKCENVEQLYDNFYYPLLVEYKELKKKYENAKNQLQQKENIIKEVREKIENTTINCDGVAEDLIDDIYEILDRK